MRNYKWAITCRLDRTNFRGKFWNVRETRREVMWIYGSDWPWFYRHGYRCVKVRLVEVEK